MLVLANTQKRILTLCAREIQNTIKDSVHQLISRRIETMGLSDLYTITDNEIRCRNGSKFIFRGLAHNINEIKSMEGVDRCWVAQAENVSWHSWEVLIPTIRAAGSEIWIDFNPAQIDDATYDLFVTHRQSDEVYVHTTYRDNPWFPEELERERQYLLANNKAKHDHIYEGVPMLLTDARVFNPKDDNFFTMAEFGEWCNGQAKDDIRLCAGLDFGFEDADAFAVVAYSLNPKNREHWVLYQYKQRRESVTELAAAVKEAIRLTLSFPEVQALPHQEINISSDFGGGGKQIAWELYQQHGIKCFEPAIKSEKKLAVDLLRDEVVEGRIKMRTESPLEEEMTRIIWQRDARDRIIREIDDDAYHPDALWSVIYALRPVWVQSHKLMSSPEVPQMESVVRRHYGQ